MTIKRKLTVRRDTYDARDKIAPRAAAILPSYSSIEKYAAAVMNQEQTGACTAFAMSGMVELLARKASKTVSLSQLFQYWNERTIDGDTYQDDGSSARTMMQAAAKYGICTETLWPFDEAKVLDAPPADSYTPALQCRVGAYHRVADLQALKSAIHNGLPVSLSLTIYESFQSDQVASNGLVPMPQPNEQVDGGHEVFCVAYSDTKSFYGHTGAVKVRNSWGSAWGESGDFWLPYAYIENAQLTQDMWTCTLATT